MNNLRFQKITITQIQNRPINAQQILVGTFEFTGAAPGFFPGSQMLDENNVPLI